MRKRQRKRKKNADAEDIGNMTKGADEKIKKAV